MTRLILIAFLVVANFSGLMAQQSQLQFSGKANCGTYQVTLRLKAGGSAFAPGNTSLVFNYNKDVLSQPRILTSHHFNETEACASAGNYRPHAFKYKETATLGVGSFGVVLANANAGCPQLSTADWTDVVTLEFDVIGEGSAGLTWRSPQTLVLRDGNDAASVTSIQLADPLLESVTLAAPVNVTLSQSGTQLNATPISGAVYQWFKDGLKVGETTTAGFSIAGLGEYSVSVLTPNGCVGQSNALTVSTTGVSALSGVQFNVFPNPADKVFNLQYGDASAKEAVVKIVDVTGKLIYNQTHALNAGWLSLPVRCEGWASGVYSVQVSNGQTQTTRSVVLK